MSTLAESKPQPAEPQPSKSQALNCHICDSQLPLRKAKSFEQPIDWACASCGAQTRGVLNEEAHADLRFNVYPAEMTFRCDQLIHTADEITDFIGKMTPTPAVGAENRAFPRTTLISAASVMPLSEEMQPVGVAFMVMLHNISGGGVAFTHAQALKEPYVALELWAPGNERLKVAMEITRVRAIGHFYEIAGQFVASE